MLSIPQTIKQITGHKAVECVEYNSDGHLMPDAKYLVHLKLGWIFRNCECGTCSFPNVTQFKKERIVYAGIDLDGFTKERLDNVHVS